LPARALGLALFAWLISHQSAVLFSHIKPATSNQPALLFSQNKPAPAISHQPTEQAMLSALEKGVRFKRSNRNSKNVVCTPFFYAFLF
jgi:hypothetical protein